MEFLLTLPGIGETEQALADVLSSIPRLGVLVLLAVLLVFTLLSKNLGAWMASLLLVLVGVYLVLFPEAAAIGAATAAGIGSAAIVGASRRRARLMRRLGEMQDRLQAVAIDQERRRLRELKSERLTSHDGLAPSTAPSVIQEAAAPEAPRKTDAADGVEASPPATRGGAEAQGARHSE